MSYWWKVKNRYIDESLLFVYLQPNFPTQRKLKAEKTLMLDKKLFSSQVGLLKVSFGFDRVVRDNN